MRRHADPLVMSGGRVVDFALRRTALRLWGNSSHARKWLDSVRYLGDGWVLLRVEREHLREQVQVLAEAEKRRKEQWGAKVRRIRP